MDRFLPLGYALLLLGVVSLAARYRVLSQFLFEAGHWYYRRRLDRVGETIVLGTLTVRALADRVASLRGHTNVSLDTLERQLERARHLLNEAREEYARLFVIDETIRGRIRRAQFNRFFRAR